MAQSIQGRNGTAEAGPCENQASVPLNEKSSAPVAEARRPAPVCRNKPYVPTPQSHCIASCNHAVPAGNNNSSVKGNSAAGWYSAASGRPTPEYGFHQGTTPRNQSSAAR